MSEKLTQPKVLSLFSGGGGLDIGFKMAGFDIVASVEIEESFCKTLEANKDFFGSKHKVINADISEFSPESEGISNVDFIIGGPPCQSFSAAGRRAGGVYGIQDTRGTLFGHYCRVLESIKPKGFLFENVRGILSANKKEAWNTIKASFAEIGYKLHYRVLDAAEYGVPQHRERLIMVGTLEATEFLFPRPTHGPKSTDGMEYVSASCAIEDLQDPDEKYVPYGGKYEEQLLEIPPGQNYLYFTEKMGHPKPKFAWRSRFSDFLYIADPDSPTKTIVAHPGKWAGPFHWKKRKFTIRELMRLFRYQDNYTIIGTDIIATKQIGNSVPPKLAEILGLAVAKQIFAKDIPVSLVDDTFIFDHDKRKARKAKTTKSRVKSNKEIYGNQIDLFSSDVISEPEIISIHREYNYNSCPCINDSSSCQGKERHVKEVGKYKNGIWSIKVTTDHDSNRFLVLAVEFNKVIQGSLLKIEVELRTNEPTCLPLAWKAINHCIRSTTSYDNIQKLYGHFTEPYPQFVCKVVKRNSDPLAKLAEIICDYKYLGEYHSFDNLKALFSTTQKPDRIAKWLREIGIDIRTHETNRTIPIGKFRICYPFTIPESEPHFVIWRDVGTHKTADIK